MYKLLFGRKINLWLLKITVLSTSADQDEGLPSGLHVRRPESQKISSEHLFLQIIHFVLNDCVNSCMSDSEVYLLPNSCLSLLFS